MKRIATAGVLSSLLALGVPDMAPADVGIAVGVQVPAFGAVITTGPTYAPYPVYVPYPAYPPPAFAYAYPPPRYAYAHPGRGYGHYEHHKRYKHGRGCR